MANTSSFCGGCSEHCSSTRRHLAVQGFSCDAQLGSNLLPTAFWRRGVAFAQPDIKPFSQHVDADFAWLDRGRCLFIRRHLPAGAVSDALPHGRNGLHLIRGCGSDHGVGVYRPSACTARPRTNRRCNQCLARLRCSSRLRALAQIVAVADPTKDKTILAIASLHVLGLRVIMTTGDKAGQDARGGSQAAHCRGAGGVMPEARKVLIDQLHA